jgi:hypothetical protein
MNEIYACYIVYNEADKIAISLNSILPYVDKVIIIDGAFEDFKHDNPQSTDGTKEIAEKICGNKLIWVDCPKKKDKYIPWILESEKREAYLKYIPVGAWFYILDADTIWFGDIKTLSDKLRNNDTLDGNILAFVKLLNFCPLLTENPFVPFPPKLVNIRRITDWFEDLEKVLDKWASDKSPSRFNDNPISNILWFGYYQHIYGIFKKIDGMRYETQSKIFINDKSITSLLYATPPVGRKWSFAPNILAINMKFLYSVNRYFSNGVYKNNIIKDEEEKKEQIK